MKLLIHKAIDEINQVIKDEMKNLDNAETKMLIKKDGW